MLSLSSGHSADYLTSAVATGRESYYTGAVAAGEPPGRWCGRGAALLGLAGEVDTQDMTALYEHFVDPRDPAFRDPSRWVDADRLGHAGRRYVTAEQLYKLALDAEPDAAPERREELRLDAAARARANVSFIDATFSVQKSVTVLHAAFEAQEVSNRTAGRLDTAGHWAAYRQAVEAAIWAGNRAAIDYLAEHAGYTRAGHHGGGGGRFVDAHDWTVASFFQHDSRDHDPQLHIHNAVLNRVRGADGVWRTLDSRAMHRMRPAAAAVGERVMEEHLTASLGVRFATRPDGKAREIVGIPQNVLGLFSSRRRAITAKTASLVKEFEMFLGRSPNALELDRLQRQATFATRRVKEHVGESVEERLARWDRELRAEVAGGLATVAGDVLERSQRPGAPEWSPTAVLETALADVQARGASWTRPELAKAVSDAVPDYLGGLDVAQVTRLIDGLADDGIARGAVPVTAPGPAADSLPDELRLANGESMYDAPGAKRYTTARHLAAEQALADAARQAGAAAVSRELAAAFLEELRESGVELGADQAAAVRGVLTSGARVEALVGPAGTGKSFVVGALAKAWQDPAMWGGQERRVVGLAASQVATQVLEGEGLAARNIARWLATQERLASGHAGGDDAVWQLREGDLVVVDESAMASTADLTAIRRHAEAAAAKVLLTGDHRQLAAVGAAGGMSLVADTGASTYELAEVRRLSAQWEREASLRLREGDPAALQDYRKHGRIIDGGTVEQAQAAAERAFLADTLAGRDTVLITDTNEQAARLSAKVRADLVRLGRVEETGAPLGLQGTVAGVGDVVQARRNGWELIGYDGNRRAPINRERYSVVEVRDDGSLRVAPILGWGRDAMLGEPLTLPASYVAEHVALGYASTVHSAQGFTVDTCHTVAGSGTSSAALYVGMSRGRAGNTVYVATRRIPDDAPVGSTAEVEQRDPAAVLREALQREADDQAALQEAEHSATEAATVRSAAERFADVAEQAVAGRTAASLDRLVDEGLLTRDQRAELAADKGMSGLARALRQAEIAGHEPHQVLADAVAQRHLDDAHSLAGVLHHRITRAVSLEPQGDSYAEWVPKVDNPRWREHLESLAEAADQRSSELGEGAAKERPQWAVETLGPVPDDAEARSMWVKRAGAVAGHRELTGHEDPAVALPAAPKPGQIEHTASYRAAWRALGRPEADRAEAEMTNGQLRARVRAMKREEAWQPEYVANELSGTSQAEARHRQTAEIRAAEAAAAHDEAERARLEQEAREAAALAETLGRQKAQLEEADQVRALWYAHTSATRAAAERARDELGGRGIDPDETGDETTAEEWLAAHAEGDRAEDKTRVVRDEDDLADVAVQREQDEAVFDRPDETAVEVEPPEPASGPPPGKRDTDDWTRVPTADETADAVARARAALVEMNRRREREEQRARDEQRDTELARWNAEREAEQETVHEAEVPALEYAAD